MTGEQTTSTSTRVLRVPVGQELSKAEVLKVWEQLRQDVARALTGGPGVFPGYDDLEWHLPTSGGHDVLVSAHAVEVFERRHVVDYDATLVRNAGESASDQGPLIAHGRGLSLVVDRPSDPHPASPGRAASHLSGQHFGDAHA